MGERLAHHVIEKQFQNPHLKVIAGNSDFGGIAPLPGSALVGSGDIEKELRYIQRRIIGLVKRRVVIPTQDVGYELLRRYELADSVAVVVLDRRIIVAEAVQLDDAVGDEVFTRDLARASAIGVYVALRVLIARIVVRRAGVGCWHINQSFIGPQSAQ